MKGHLLNLLTELPHILDKPAKPACDDLLKHILFSKRENGFSGSDLRVALIETYKLLFHQNVPPDVKILLSTAVKVSEILYSGDDKPTPKSILQLHNCMWVHHELCKDLFSTRREITYQKLFGAYLHSLLAHAPRQYEIICLRSVNTENQERMFQQAKK